MTDDDVSPATVRQLHPVDPLFPAAAALFDEYRQHYGANPAPAASHQWLRTHTAAGRLRVYAATGPGEVRAVLTVSVVPASLTLRTVWFVRDLYVAPSARRGGLARALLDHVAGAARAEGAHRLSLQTETDNAAARALYAGRGFTPVTGLTQLQLPV